MGSIDAFNFCWCALQEECKKLNCELSLEKNLPILDSRDTNFNDVKNRLAYMYQLGSNVITIVDACVSCFLQQCSDPLKKTLSEKTKICSLSNGPGIDIVGYLIALYKSKIQLNCFPLLRGINMYESWSEMFARVTSIAHREYCKKARIDCIDIPVENIKLIPADIFTNISPEVQECIESSDILLMFKVFVSTKAVSQLVTSKIKEILLLLKPGALVFYFGSKKNVKEVTSMSLLKVLSDILLNPAKVTVDNLPFNDSVLKITGFKPKQSDKVYFMVFKRNSIGAERLDALQEITKKTKKKRSRKNKKKSEVFMTPSISSCDVSLTDDIEDEYSDNESFSSFNSSSKLSDKMKSVSYEILSQSSTSEEVISFDHKRVSASTSIENSLQKFESVASGVAVNISASKECVEKEDINFVHLLTSEGEFYKERIEDKNEEKSHKEMNETCNIAEKSISTYSSDVLENINETTIVDNASSEERKNMLEPVSEDIKNCAHLRLNESEFSKAESLVQDKSDVKYLLETNETLSFVNENVSRCQSDVLQCTNEINLLDDFMKYENNAKKYANELFECVNKTNSLGINENKEIDKTLNTSEENIDEYLIDFSQSSNKIPSLDTFVECEQNAKRYSHDLFNCVKGINSMHITKKETLECANEKTSLNHIIQDSNVKRCSVDEILSTELCSPVKYTSPPKMQLQKDPNILQDRKIKSSDITSFDENLNEEIKITNEIKMRNVSQNNSGSCENVKKNMNNFKLENVQREGQCSATLLKDKSSMLRNETSYTASEVMTKIKIKKDEHGKASNNESFKSSFQCPSEELSNLNEKGTYSMLQHCETLVTSLEKLVENISSEINVTKENSAAKCCSKEYAEVNNLCCFCHRFVQQNGTKMCPGSKSQVITHHSRFCYCRKHNNENPDHDTAYSRNVTGPYLAIPLQNEDVSRILNLISNKS